MPGGNALVSFRGTKVDERIAALVADPRVAGVVLYLPFNIETAAQTGELCNGLVEAAGRPLLIAVDQEGGQLLAAGPDATPFPGNMALGAVGDFTLTRRVGSAIGRELRALGINVDLAPVADVATRPHNPSMGIRSFGEDPVTVAGHTAAFVEGLQSQGVAATLKHFPGKGEADLDPHLGLPILDLDTERLDAVEFTPFRAGFEAGARLVMVGHYGLPAVIGDSVTPTSVSPEVMVGVLRGRLCFDGLIVTDALDMGGFGGWSAEAPLAAGADLLLYGPAQAGALPAGDPGEGTRLASVLDWLEGFETPEVSVVGCAEHLSLAADVARKSITVVRDDEGMLPLRPGPDQRILTVMPRPKDLTPADTSSLVEPALASAIRTHHPQATEVIVDFDPDSAEVTYVAEQARGHDYVIVGTIDASKGQTDLVDAVLATGSRVITIALRTPYDLARYPRSKTHLCSYGILPVTMEALASTVFGEGGQGRLPVAIPGLYPLGHGLVGR